MERKWHYADNGQKVGPLSDEEIKVRIRQAKDKPHYVWAPGMPDWADARTLQQFAAEFRGIEAVPQLPLASADNSTRQAETGHTTIGQRARHELIAYLAVSGYLMVWFSAVMFYKATILGSVGIEFTPFGLAVVKALILGKFILVLEALRIGERREQSILAIEIAKEALFFTILLIVLSIVEELIVGYLHGRAASEVLSQMGGGTAPQAIAMGVLMFLVLIPYLAFRRLALTFGELPELLFTRRPPEQRK